MSPGDYQAYGDARVEYEDAVKDLERAEGRVARADRRCREEGEKLSAKLQAAAAKKCLGCRRPIDGAKMFVESCVRCEWGNL